MVHNNVVDANVLWNFEGVQLEAFQASRPDVTQTLGLDIHAQRTRSAKGRRAPFQRVGIGADVEAIVTGEIRKSIGIFEYICNLELCNTRTLGRDSPMVNGRERGMQGTLRAAKATLAQGHMRERFSIGHNELGLSER